MLVSVVIGLALFAFILGDLMAPGGTILGNSRMDIAEISGKTISYIDYQNRIDYLAELNKGQSQDGSVDEQTMERIREEVWNDILRQSVMEPKYERLGITVSAAELFDMIQGRNIHPIIRQQFSNPQTGEVDRDFIIQFLKTMDDDPSGNQKRVWLYLEDLIIKDRLFSKYNTLIQKGMFATTLQAQRALADRNKRVDLDFVLKRYTAIPDSLVPFTMRDLKEYYRENKNQFEQQAARSIEYVLFPLVPSADDHQLAQEWINRIANDFATTSEPSQFVNLNSDTPFAPRFLKRTDIENQDMAEWAFSAKESEVFGPALEGETFVMARLTKIASLPDSVKARHILIQPQDQSALAKEAARSRADSILSVVKRGGDFAQLAKEFSADPGSASEGGDLGWFAEGVMVQPFNDASFNSRKGEITLVETQFGFHIIEVLDRGAPSPKVQLAVLERRVIPSTRTYQSVFSRASEFAGVNTTHEQFARAAQDLGLTKRVASNLRENDRQIAGLEHAREMIRWAYQADKNAVSPVFEMGENFVVAALVDVKEDGIAPLEDVKPQVEQQVIRDKKAELLKEEMSVAIASKASLAEMANELSLPVQNAQRISFSSFMLPGTGFEPAVIATAVNTNQGQLVGPVKGNAGVFALTVTAISSEEGDAEAERGRLRNTYNSRAMQELYEAIKEQADIKDNRSKFF